jgi:hypothetical protein
MITEKQLKTYDAGYAYLSVDTLETPGALNTGVRTLPPGEDCDLVVPGHSVLSLHSSTLSHLMSRYFTLVQAAQIVHYFYHPVDAPAVSSHPKPLSFQQCVLTGVRLQTILRLHTHRKTSNPP